MLVEPAVQLDPHFLGEREQQRLRLEVRVGNVRAHPVVVERRKEFAAKQGSPGNPETFLVISGPDYKSQTQFAQKRLAGTYYVSASGKYLAYVEERRLPPNFQPEPHLWGKDLQSGEEKELFVAPAPNPPTSPEPNVVLTVPGWAN